MATICSATFAGLPVDCDASQGGLQRVLIANFSDVQEVTEGENKITAIKMVSTKHFFAYDLAPDVSSMTTTMNKNVQNGSLFFTTDVALMFLRMDTIKRTEVEAMSMAHMAVIVEDKNGKYWYLGKDEAVMASAGEDGTGTARGDANKYGITLQDNARQRPYEVESSIIAALLTPGA